MEKIKLYRSRNENMIQGVFGGLAPLLKIDATILRLAFTLVALFTAIFPAIVIYIIAAIIIPLEPDI